jgi:hypothetical protein
MNFNYGLTNDDNNYNERTKDIVNEIDTKSS